jgi:hypothetical protein
MRTFISTLLATALLVFSASSASALAISLGGASGSTTPGSQVSVTVSIDAEGTTGIVTFSVGVLFDDAQLSYNQAASSTTSYTLYNTVTNPKTGVVGPGTYLNAASTCGGSYYSPSAGAGCELRVGTTNQVNVDYISTGFPTTGTTGGTADLMATLVFDVIGASGSAAISLSLSSPGNVIGDNTGAAIAATTSGSGSISIIPEPTTALLVGLGLAGLGIAGRRRE